MRSDVGFPRRLQAFVIATTLAPIVVTIAFQHARSSTLVRDAVTTHGSYIARSLAQSSRYGVSTDDRELLAQLLQEAVSAGGREFVGAAIRDVDGDILAQVGVPIQSLPKRPANAMEQFDSVTPDGSPATLVRFPIRGIKPEADDRSELQGWGVRDVALKTGGVEVLLSIDLVSMRSQRVLIETGLVALVALALSSLGAWRVAGMSGWGSGGRPRNGDS